jgi:bacterioferritin
VLRYKRHYFMAAGITARAWRRSSSQHASEEQAHADEIAQRIVQLGGEPNLSPEGMLEPQPLRVRRGRQLVDMIREDLVAERVAIDSYRELIVYFGNGRHDDAAHASRASWRSRRSTRRTS